MKQNLDTLWKDDKHWKLKSIYVCEEDPRVVVAKRTKWAGWTFNFAHRASIILLILIMVILFIPTNYAIHTDRLDLLPYAIGLSAIAVIFVTYLFSRIGRD